MSKYKRIFIVGHPGAGKALLAKSLAERLGWQFIDADLGLELKIGRTLIETLGAEGQKTFQETEFKILQSFCEKENIVVTTNGSIVCANKNRQLLSAEFTIHLQVSTDVQIDRTARNPSPLLSINLKSFFDALHIERDQFYNQIATVCVDSSDNALEKHVVEITNRISQQKKPSYNTKLQKNDYLIFHKTKHTPVNLTEQQAICLKLLTKGKSSKEIARDMRISYRTVEGYIADITELTGCGSSKELVALYYQI